MTAKSVFKSVDPHYEINNTAHHTREITDKILVVRRGQPFTVTVALNEPFKPAQRLSIVVNIGDHPSEEKGTLCKLSVPDGVPASPNAKAVWTVQQDRKSSPYTGVLVLNFTPPADAPIGQFFMNATYGGEEKTLVDPVVLFNPWCREDAVYMADEKLRQEYVMNEHGKIYRGSEGHISGMDWDFAQFEENMVEICLWMLFMSNQHMEDPSEDIANRASPGYVGRLISAMINSDGDYGVIEGNWGGDFSEGHRPTHWTGSSAILTEWLNKDFHPVKYGQCWVFAGVMCTVMRFLGIPCRVISNFNSAHDTNANLTIDLYRAEEGASWLETDDSVWNFHVWVEGWMTRPDLTPKGRYDGWQVLDPTPQELSGGAFQCGPASKMAIVQGIVDKDYDVPFVYAEVNGDINWWLTKKDYTLQKMKTDTEHVGKSISTKAVGTEEREDITDTYKPKEGSIWERFTFSRAVVINHKQLLEMRKKEKEEREAAMAAAAAAGEAENEMTITNVTDIGEATITPAEEEGRVNGTTTTTTTNLSGEATISRAGEENEGPGPVTESRTEEPDAPLPPDVTMEFEEVSLPINGKDVEMKLVLRSDITTDRTLVIDLEVTGMHYYGRPADKIMKMTTIETMKPGEPVIVPMTIYFDQYKMPMMNNDSMRISALVVDLVNPPYPYLKEHTLVLENPPIKVYPLGEARLNKPVVVEVLFENPVNEILTNCTLTVSGSGLQRGELETGVTDLRPSNRLRTKITLYPYKTGPRTLTADFDCHLFRDIKASCVINVKH